MSDGILSGFCVDLVLLGVWVFRRSVGLSGVFGSVSGFGCVVGFDV